jgi:DNA mismatch repair ATPase MutS
VLIDEFARTTSPREGRALLVALLERLAAGDARGLAATHLHGIAAEAGAEHFAIVGLRELPPRSGTPRDLASALERIGRAMDYRIARVDEDALPRADALDLAALLGLDDELLARARAAL